MPPCRSEPSPSRAADIQSGFWTGETQAKPPGSLRIASISCISDLFLTHPPAPAQHRPGRPCRELFQAALPENRYTWGNRLWRLRGPVASWEQEGQCAPKPFHGGRRPSKANVEGIDDEDHQQKPVGSQLWEVVHPPGLAPASFEQTHGRQHLHRRLTPYEVGTFKVIVGRAKNRGDRYRIANDVVTMVQPPHPTARW